MSHVDDRPFAIIAGWPLIKGARDFTRGAHKNVPGGLYPGQLYPGHTRWVGSPELTVLGRLAHYGGAVAFCQSFCRRLGRSGPVIDGFEFPSPAACYCNLGRFVADRGSVNQALTCIALWSVDTCRAMAPCTCQNLCSRVS